MLKNLHLKVIALLLAIFFWVFVVSIENTFLKFPEPLDVEVFNLGEGLALASHLSKVNVTLRTQDSNLLRGVSKADFEAYVDLRNVGAGDHRLPVSVTSKNAQVSVLRVDPSEVEMMIEPIREKAVSLLADVHGEPAPGYRLDSTRLSITSLSIYGAESQLKKIASARAAVSLSRTERESKSLPVQIRIMDSAGIILEGLKQKSEQEVTAFLTIVPTENSISLGVRPRFTGSLEGGVIKKIEITQAVVAVKGSGDALAILQILETEPIDLKDVKESFERKVRLVLPAGIRLSEGEKSEVTVKVTVEAL